jgi:hypothetical protein
MSVTDYNSSLPVKTQADVDERLQIKIVDGTDVTKMATVDSDKNLHIENHGNDPAGVDRVQRMSENGHAAVDGLYNATTNTDPSQVGLVGHARAASPADTDQTKRLTAVTSGTSTSLDISLHDDQGVPYSYANPLAVYQTESPGLELQDYFESASAVAKNATDVHTYTVPVGKTLKLDQILCAASEVARFQIETSQDGTTFTTLAVRFNSTSQPQAADMFLSRIVSIPAGGKVKITRLNRGNAQTMYTTIVGVLN